MQCFDFVTHCISWKTHSYECFKSNIECSESAFALAEFILSRHNEYKLQLLIPLDWFGSSKANKNTNLLGDASNWQWYINLESPFIYIKKYKNIYHWVPRNTRVQGWIQNVLFNNFGNIRMNNISNCLCLIRKGMSCFHKYIIL